MTTICASWSLDSMIAAFAKSSDVISLPLPGVCGDLLPMIFDRLLPDATWEKQSGKKFGTPMLQTYIYIYIYISNSGYNKWNIIIMITFTVVST